MTERTDRRGFTLVEAAIVVVVIALILTFTIPWMLERERARLQVMADNYPWEVFDLRAKPANASFAEGEYAIIQCEILNVTNYPLALPKDLAILQIIVEDTDYIAAGAMSFPCPNQKAAIAPRESIRFELRLDPIGTGMAEFRAISPYYVLRNLRGTVEKRFQSDTFKFVVEASENSKRLTFEALIDMPHR
jgi:prepilin-type N-terminal cleavage/methylation domain-containing protein